MKKTIIYGLLNEDREIVFISDLQPIDWHPDYWIEEDADWKIIKLNNKELIDEVDERNIVILEYIDTIDEEEIKKVLNKWIEIIKPKYILDYISPIDLMDFRIRIEKEWDEEDKKLI